MVSKTTGVISAWRLLACVALTVIIIGLFFLLFLWSIMYQFAVDLTDSYGDARGIYHTVFGIIIMIGGGTTLVTCAAACLLFQGMAVSVKS